LRAIEPCSRNALAGGSKTVGEPFICAPFSRERRQYYYSRDALATKTDGLPSRRTGPTWCLIRL
jgi:hypothetical protein